jgi:hypothetical protein
MQKTQAQLDYEADVAKTPFYKDGKTPRRTWEQLKPVAQKSWSWGIDHEDEAVEEKEL